MGEITVSVLGAIAPVPRMRKKCKPGIPSRKNYPLAIAFFGLTFTFEPADQATYLEIVQHLAQQRNLNIDAETLAFRAKQWATRHNGRSGRTAKQFIDYLQGELALTKPEKT